MVFDVVASRQRNYDKKVQRLVELYEQAWPEETLSGLAAVGSRSGFSLMDEEWMTVIGVAGALGRFERDRGLSGASNDDVVNAWAIEVEPIRFSPRLDPYVGSVKGIGPALFAYLRMRSGADALKPDGRLRRKMLGLGFPVPPDDTGLILLAEAAAEDLKVGRLYLDQLLW
jgi:hypothetical protein